MSFPHLPSSQANSGYQQRATQPPHALVPRPQSKDILGFQSVLMPGQAAGSHPDLYQQFAEVRTSTYEWVLVSITDKQRPGALNGSSQIVPGGVPSGMPPFTGNGPEQKVQFGTSQPTQVPIEGMRTTVSRGPGFFNSESQARASQLRASGMGSASYGGGPHEGRRSSEHNRGR